MLVCDLLSTPMTQTRIVVSILVLVDVGLRLYKVYLGGVDNGVSILVLVDVGLRRNQ